MENKNQEKRVRLLLILLATTLAAYVRLFGIHNVGPGHGEMNLLSVIDNVTPWQIFQECRGINRPILSLYILYWWNSFWGGNALFAGRMLSVVFSVMTVPVMYLLGKTIFDRKIGILSAFLFAVAPVHVWESQLINNYTMFAFFAAVSLLFFIHAIKKNKPVYWIFYIIFASARFFTHYYAIFITIFENVYVLVFRKKYKNLKIWVLAQSALVLISSPIVYLFVFRIFAECHTKASGVAPSYWVPHAGLKEIVLAVPNMLFSFSFLELFNVMPLWKFIRIIGTLFVVVFFIRGIRSLMGKGKKEGAFLITSYLLIPLIFGFPIVFINWGKYSCRYFIFLSPIIYLALSEGILSIKKNWLKYAFICIIFLFAACTLVKFHLRGYEEKPHWDEAVSYIERNFRGNDVILTCPSGLINYVKYCSNGRLASYGIPDNFNWENFRQKVLEPSDLIFIKDKIKDKKRVWLITVGLKDFDPHRLVLTYFKSRYKLADYKVVPKDIEIEIRRFDTKD
jgi:hypothetical protein